ncbi:hypothetical protein CSUI_006104 [Cystoisospora suis]|uniref:Uncharacterized protein n=1 Tax=Cystoisospora suis TaxID=483139 RepID=A0A2C6KSY1_9APIC|nr:hypothetical protein CSUI_006104 [Cystoisospora suis]
MANPACPLCTGNGTYRLGARVQLRERLLAQHGLSPAFRSVLQSTVSTSTPTLWSPSATFSPSDPAHPAVRGSEHSSTRLPETANCGASCSMEGFAKGRDQPRLGCGRASPVSGSEEDKQSSHLEWLRRHLLCGLREQEEQIYQCPFCCASRLGTSFNNPDGHSAKCNSLGLTSPSHSLSDNTELGRFSSVAINEERARKVQASLGRRMQLDGGVLVVENLSPDEVTAQFVKKEEVAGTSAALQEGTSFTSPLVSWKPVTCLGRPHSPLSTESSSGFSCPLSAHDAFSTSVLSSPRMSSPSSPSNSFPLGTLSSCRRVLSSVSDGPQALRDLPLSPQSSPASHHDLSLLSLANQQVLAQLVRMGYHFDRAYTAIRLSNFSPILGVCVAKAEELEAAEVNKLLLDLGAVQAREAIDVTRASRKQKVLAGLQSGLVPLWDEFPEFMQKFAFASPTLFRLLREANSRVTLYKFLQLRASAIKAYPLVACAYFRRTDAMLARLLTGLDRARGPLRNIWHRRLLVRYFNRMRRASSLLSHNKEKNNVESSSHQIARNKERREHTRYMQEAEKPDSLTPILEETDRTNDSFCSTFPFLSGATHTSCACSVRPSPFTVSHGSFTLNSQQPSTKQGGRRAKKTAVSSSSVLRRSPRHLQASSAGSPSGGSPSRLSSSADPACSLHCKGLADETPSPTDKVRDRSARRARYAATATRATTNGETTESSRRCSRKSCSAQGKLVGEKVDGSSQDSRGSVEESSFADDGVMKKRESGTRSQASQRTDADPTEEPPGEEGVEREHFTELENSMKGADGHAFKQQVLQQFLDDQTDELQNVFLFSNVGSLAAPPGFRFARAVEGLLRDIFLAIPSSLASLSSVIAFNEEDRKDGHTREEKSFKVTRPSSTSALQSAPSSPLFFDPNVSMLSSTTTGTCQVCPTRDSPVLLPFQRMYVRLHPDLWPPVLVARVLTDNSESHEFPLDMNFFSSPTPLAPREEQSISNLGGESLTLRSKEEERAADPAGFASTLSPSRRQIDSCGVKTNCRPLEKEKEEQNQGSKGQFHVQEEQKDNTTESVSDFGYEGPSARKEGREENHEEENDDDDDCMITYVSVSEVAPAGQTLNSRAKVVAPYPGQMNYEKSDNSDPTISSGQMLHEPRRGIEVSADSEEELRRAIELSLSTYSREQTAKRRKNALITDFFPVLGEKQNDKVRSHSTGFSGRRKNTKAPLTNSGTNIQRKASTAVSPLRQPESMLNAKKRKGGVGSSSFSSLKASSKQKSPTGICLSNLHLQKTSSKAKTDSKHIGPAMINVSSAGSVQSEESRELPSPLLSSCYHPSGCSASFSSVSCFSTLSVASSSHTVDFPTVDMEEIRLPVPPCSSAGEEWCDDLTSEKEIEEEALVDAAVGELGCTSSSSSSSHSSSTRSDRGGRRGDEETDLSLYQLQVTSGKWKLMLVYMHTSGCPSRNSQGELSGTISSPSDTSKLPSSRASLESSTQENTSSSSVGCSPLATPSPFLDISAFEVLTGRQKRMLLDDLAEELWHAVYDEVNAHREAEDARPFSRTAKSESRSLLEKENCSSTSPLSSSVPLAEAVPDHAASVKGKTCRGSTAGSASVAEGAGEVIPRLSEEKARDPDGSGNPAGEKKDGQQVQIPLTIRTGNWIQASAFFSELVRQRVMHRWGWDKKEGKDGSCLRRQEGEEQTDPCGDDGDGNDVEFVGTSSPLKGL